MANKILAEVQLGVEAPRKKYDLLENARRTLEAKQATQKELQAKVNNFLAYKRLQEITLDCNDIKAAIQDEEARRG